jgi:hypothetical protein
MYSFLSSFLPLFFRRYSDCGSFDTRIYLNIVAVKQQEDCNVILQIWKEEFYFSIWARSTDTDLSWHSLLPKILLLWVLHHLIYESFNSVSAGGAVCHLRASRIHELQVMLCAEERRIGTWKSFSMWSNADRVSETLMLVSRCGLPIRLNMHGLKSLEM